jgi:hypothetical protein
MTLIDWRVAAGTSIAAVVPAHSLCIGSLFIVATIVQVMVLTGVACRTRNITGPWVPPGLSRNIPQMFWAWT